MSVMRINDKHLGQVLILCEFVIEQTDSSHPKNVIAKDLIKRITKFIEQSGAQRQNQVNQFMNEQENKGVLPI